MVAAWKPPKPIPTKRRGAVSLWVRAAPEVRLALIVTDTNENTRNYPFDVVTLENPAGANWRQILIPLAAKSTGYFDEDHPGRPEGKIRSIGLTMENRFPGPINGKVEFDELQLLDSADQTFVLRQDALREDAVLELAPPDSARLSTRLGVSIHVLGDPVLLDAARDAGFGLVRADLLWRQVERNGRFRFGVYDRLLNALDARQMRALWILDYGHPGHGGDPPRKPDDVAAFARFAEETASHFKGRNVSYEIWNEPNTERFWPPSPNAREYAALLNASAMAIHRADPSARVASGGLGRVDLTFLQEIIQAAGTEIAAAGVHPYRRKPPESVAADVPLLKQLLLSPARRGLELWDTEWGYASYDYFSSNLRGDGHSTQGRKRQAVLACREVLAIWSLGLPLGVWYDLRNDGDDPRNPEHNYGLLDAHNNDKPAMQAIRTLTRVSADHGYSGAVRDVPDGIHVLRLDGKQEKILAVWTEQPDAQATLRFQTDGFIEATNLFGEPLKLKGGKDEAEIRLLETDGPVYLKFSDQKR